MPSILHRCAQSLTVAAASLSPPLHPNHSSVRLPHLCCCRCCWCCCSGPGWRQRAGRPSRAEPRTAVPTPVPSRLRARYGDALGWKGHFSFLSVHLKQCNTADWSAWDVFKVVRSQMFDSGLTDRLVSLWIFWRLFLSESSPFRAAAASRWRDGSPLPPPAGISLHLGPNVRTRTRTRTKWIGSRWGDPAALFFFFFFFFFKYTYVSNHVTSDTALDVAADMSFGHRFFLVALCLGIVPSRFGHCNQGEFNEPLGGFPNLTVSVLLQCIFSADPSFQTALFSL